MEEISSIRNSQRRQRLGRPPDVKDSPTSNPTVNLAPTKPSVSFNTESESEVCPKKGPAETNPDVCLKKGPAEKNPDVCLKKGPAGDENSQSNKSDVSLFKVIDLNTASQKIR